MQPPTQLDHFLVDTSRNGLGAWTPPAGKYTGDAQTWCNPPVRAIGARPTADTGIALVDAYLYVKRSASPTAVAPAARPDR